MCGVSLKTYSWEEALGRKLFVGLGEAKARDVVLVVTHCCYAATDGTAMMTVRLNTCEPVEVDM